MQINLINQSYHEDIVAFKAKTLRLKWDTLILTTAGEYGITLSEMDKEMVLRENDIALIPGGVRFDRWTLSSASFYHICFYPQADHPFYLSAPLGKFRLPKEQAEAILKTVKRAFILPDNRELITHAVEHIFYQNYLFGSRDHVKLKPLSHEVESAIGYMRRNFYKKIDIDELAEQVFLSHSGLIWKFKQELNTTPSNYLSVLRLDYGKQLLLNYAYSISEISEMCGFSNPYYFTNAFHRYAGMSPTQFRKFYLKEQ